ncbi:hypothetical protein [Martelella radicis]|uniref:Uncharacterized protein n=1 Tax=Martelella radicis TaxID=1397476 RepID=A0A7W6KHB0_9HYPH|nr:hypothetical protein [Martelella radicis]MBB4121293.1 hypothetical protein [Martelella radicis]
MIEIIFADGLRALVAGNAASHSSSAEAVAVAAASFTLNVLVGFENVVNAVGQTNKGIVCANGLRRTPAYSSKRLHKTQQ